MINRIVEGRFSIGSGRAARALIYSLQSAVCSPQSAVANPQIVNLQSPISNHLLHRKRPLHVLALLVEREVAIERKGARPIGPELEGDGLAGPCALRDAVVVDREAVGQ